MPTAVNALELLMEAIEIYAGKKKGREDVFYTRPFDESLCATAMTMCAGKNR